ncbi:MAG: hypothetical protein JKY56_23120 [Kofleriaceae bacterium]|nr:hypothetical protein [Kofleriaceae bacterium]
MSTFVHWYLLAESQMVPATSGMFQIRVESGLIDYPKGKSAMVYYGCAENMQLEIVKIAAQREAENFLCRHQSTGEPAVLLERMRNRFRERFGVFPSWPEG